MEPITPDELREWMAEHERSVRGLASELGTDPTAITRWLNGSRPVPGWLRFALRGISCIDRH